MTFVKGNVGIFKAITAVLFTIMLAGCSGDSGPSASDIEKVLSGAMEKRGIDIISVSQIKILETKSAEDKEDVRGVKFEASYELQKDYDNLEFDEKRHVGRLFNGTDSKKGDVVTEEGQMVLTKKDGAWVGKI